MTVLEGRCGKIFGVRNLLVRVVDIGSFLRTANVLSISQSTATLSACADDLEAGRLVRVLVEELQRNPLLRGPD